MLALFLTLALTSAAAAANSITAADIAGSWTGRLALDGDTTAVGFAFSPDTSGRVGIEYTLPALHFDRVALGAARFVVKGDSVRVGPFRFVLDRKRGILAGTMPGVFFPVYDVRVTLHRGDVPAPAARPSPAASVTPRWVFDGGSAIWAGPTYADGVVYAGTQAGKVFALRGATGERLWEFSAGGAIRCRPTCTGDAVYVAADDGVLYRLARASGRIVWQVKLSPKPVVRLPSGDPASRFDRFGSDVTIAAGKLYVGTSDGRMIALAADTGGILWEFHAGDAVLAAPAVASGRLVFGSYDNFVYSLGAADGTLAWKFDTRGRVVSTPALAGDRVVVGNRIYDLLALDAKAGAVAWRSYQWGTWVESSPSIRDGVAYVGSSDGACVSAWEVASGKRLWLADVIGWSWGQPAVTADRVYAGVSGQVGYPVENLGAVVALDRATGAMVWRFAPGAPASGDWGFPGSPAVGTDLVYAGGLDGKVYALGR